MTAQVIPFPRHRMVLCHDMAGRVALVCDSCQGQGGLDLPTDCPQAEMQLLEMVAVMNGHLDFRAGRWVCVSEEGRRPVG
jgi:hypothetical protein